MQNKGLIIGLFLVISYVDIKNSNQNTKNTKKLMQHTGSPVIEIIHEYFRKHKCSDSLET